MRITTAAEQIQAQLRSRIEQATAAADGASEQVTALSEQVRHAAGQLMEAQESGERQSVSRVRTKQRLAGLQAEHDGAIAELSGSG